MTTSSTTNSEPLRYKHLILDRSIPQILGPAHDTLLQTGISPGYVLETALNFHLHHMQGEYEGVPEYVILDELQNQLDLSLQNVVDDIYAGENPDQETTAAMERLDTTSLSIQCLGFLRQSEQLFRTVGLNSPYTIVDEVNPVVGMDDLTDICWADVG